MWDWFVFLVMSLLTVGLGALWAQRRLPGTLFSLFMAALVLRIVGSTARLEVLQQVYSGAGDARMYYELGRDYATRITHLDLDFVVGADSPDGRWWGTQFVRTVAGFVVLLTAESFRGAFLMFSLFSFVGLVLCVLAFRETMGDDPTHARWVWLMPSLWFWPSSIGKEALMVLGAGLCVYGYVGRQGRTRWETLLLGIALAAAIRPHVAAIMALCLVIAESMRPGPLFGQRRILGLLIAGAVVAVSVQAGLAQMGLADADLDGIQEEFEFRSGQTAQGGSRIESSSGWASIPMAFFTILMRPFPWEARGIAILSSVEITLFWLLVVYRARNVQRLLVIWKTSPFLRFALPFVAGMSLMYGLAFANLGIIARQRAIILPFLLVLLHPVPVAAAVKAAQQPLLPMRRAS